MIAACGCAVIPVRERVLTGTQVTPGMLGFVHAGVTPRDTVVHRLGPPTIEFPDLRMIAYSWQVLTARVPWVIPFGTAGVQDLGRHDVLSIAFDPSDRVLAYDLGPRRGATLRTHALRWGERLGMPKPPARFVAAPIPTGTARLYVYRRGGWHDAKGVSQPAVSVDGQLVAELRKGAFVSLPLTPGTHEVAVDPVPDATLKGSKPGSRPIRTLTIHATADSAYYLELWVRFGFGALDPALELHSAAVAEPVLRRMRPTW
jgi:hypothetical protein